MAAPTRISSQVLDPHSLWGRRKSDRLEAKQLRMCLLSKRVVILSVARSSPRHSREPTRSLGFARRGQLIILVVLRIASWILGTSFPLKKGPSARGLQTLPHSKTGTRALLGPCAPAFHRCALRRRRRSRRRCCYTLSAACTRNALVRS